MKSNTFQGTPTKQSRNRTLLSCTECHRRKQKCNRNYPCNHCIERGVPHKCVFKIPMRPQTSNADARTVKDARIRRILIGEEVLLSPESVNDLQNPRLLVTLVEGSNEHFLDHNAWPTSATATAYGSSPLIQVNGFDPFSALPDKVGEPIHKEVLIEYFLQKLAPWLSSYDDGQMPNSPAFSWLPFALHHPPLFYATLLSAAVHMDRQKPMDEHILLWYKTETMGLANETLNNPKEGVADQMLLVVLILLYFNVGGGDPEEYETHLAGINRMLTLRGGMDNLGMRGMIRNWLYICYGPWNDDWHYGLFADFHGIKRETRRESLFVTDVTT